jgi:hypothetical protein
MDFPIGARTSGRTLSGVVIATVLTVSLAAASGAAPDVRGPIVGYLSQTTRPTLRAIVGVPGAAGFSDELLLPTDVARVHVAPGEPYALIERNGVPLAVVHLVGAVAGQDLPITGALQGPDLVAFSPLGRSVLLFSKIAARLQVITNLPDSPRIAQELDVRSLPEALEAMAVSDDASSVLLSSAGTVYRLLADGSTRTVAGVGEAALLAFFPNGKDGAIADRSTGSVYRFHGATGTAALRSVSAGLKGVGGIGTGNDNDTVYLSNSGDHRITSVSLQSGELRAFDLPVSPIQMDRLGTTDTFLISSESEQPAWLFFRDGLDGRAVFVPAVRKISPRRHYRPDARNF